MEVLLFYIALIALPILIGIISSVVSSISYSIKLKRLRPKILSINLQEYESQFSSYTNSYNELKQRIDSLKKLIDDKRNIKESVWFYITNDSNHQKVKNKRTTKVRTNKYRRY